MNRNVKIWLIMGTLIVVALLTTFWALISFHLPLPGQQRPFPSQGVPGDIELYYTIRMVISTINVTLLFVLFITYISIYLRTKSEFTIGLMIFTIILLLNAITSNPLITQIFGFRAFGLGPFAMLPDLFTFVALIVLLYLTFKY